MVNIENIKAEIKYHMVSVFYYIYLWKDFGHEIKKSELRLPLLSPGTTQINETVTVTCEDKIWTYFVGAYPVYRHNVGDQRSFRLITSQLIESGACRLIDIVKTFGVSKSSAIRALNKLRTLDPDASIPPLSFCYIASKIR